MPARRQHRDQISDQEEIVEFEHLLQHEQANGQIVARGKTRFLDRTEPVLCRGRSGTIRNRALGSALNGFLNGSWSAKRDVGHVSPRIPGCRRHAQRLESAGTIRDKANTRPLIGKAMLGVIAEMQGLLPWIVLASLQAAEVCSLSPCGRGVG